jgi:hypothetical protein
LSCPFILQEGVNTASTIKGRASMAGGNGFPVVTGDWLAVAVSAQISGLDLNDTNIGIVLLQTSGQIPISISQSTVFATGSKMGLWTWIQGTTITSLPPPLGSSTNCSGFLDCILPNLVFSLCSHQTSACQNASGLLWAILLSIFFSFFVWKMGANILPGVRLPFGEIFLLMALVWILVMSGLGLILVWVPLFFFFVISLFVGKKTGVYL